MGPLLFKICITGNDISTSVSCTARLLADDTSLMVEDHNDLHKNDLHKKITTETFSLNKWVTYLSTLPISSGEFRFRGFLPVTRSQQKISRYHNLA